MKRAVYIQKDVDQITTIEGMTSIFEAIASIHIAQIKDKVMTSTAFFDELWQIYRQLLRGEQDYGHHRKPAITDRPALVIMTSNGGLTGDIDERLVQLMTEHPDYQKADIFSIGSHGSILLGRRGLKATKVFPLPDTDENINVSPIAQTINQYASVTVYYQKYLSLLKQEVSRIDLFSVVANLGAAEKGEQVDIISQKDYIFEPSIEEIAAYMEAIMLEIAIAQLILESKLAQYASRFNTMSAAKSKAKDMERDLKLTLNRAKRAQADERTKEVLSGMKALKGGR
jgi:F-type H+-transporting ATPase subunit gamma